MLRSNNYISKHSLDKQCSRIEIYSRLGLAKLQRDQALFFKHSAWLVAPLPGRLLLHPKEACWTPWRLKRLPSFQNLGPLPTTIVRVLLHQKLMVWRHPRMPLTNHRAQMPNWNPRQAVLDQVGSIGSVMITWMDTFCWASSCQSRHPMCDLEQINGRGSKSMPCQSSLAWILIATVLCSLDLLLVQSNGCVSKGPWHGSSLKWCWRTALYHHTSLCHGLLWILPWNDTNRFNKYSIYA